MREVYSDFMDLLAVKRAEKEGFANFESRFQAQVAKFNSHFADSEFPEALTVFLLLGTQTLITLSESLY